MKDYLVKHPWKIIENTFHPEYSQVSESIFSVANGYMGVRGTFEEKYSGETLQGSYISGIYYPDKTRVGWWKNGYPEYFAKVLNSVNWIGIDLYLDDAIVDLNKVKLASFYRELDMQHSVYRKTLTIETVKGNISIESERFCSQVTKELGVVKYTITSEGFSGDIKIDSYLDANVKNQDSNYDFHVHASMLNIIDDHEAISSNANGKCSEQFNLSLKQGDSVTLYKYVSISTSFHHGHGFEMINDDILDVVKGSTYQKILRNHMDSWLANWEKNDIEIKGDVAAQQGMRFNILQLYQTYDGSDERLNIGPKGFTGEKYGGCTYWDTEAYCLPFYLSTADSKVARSLLVYRHNHLQKAIENAEKLGFSGGAALYPMVTMNGEECHNEWEITFEEIHRNGAIAFAIFDYIRYTGDKAYLAEYGLEVLIGIARFWAQRFHYSEAKKAFVMLGVTGPNEYENNVHNNWYTNYVARWCLSYCNDVINELKENNNKRLKDILHKTNFHQTELEHWEKIIENTYLPYDKEREIYLQQDGFLDKELKSIDAIPAEETPIHQHWSWDRILRSCYIKQADVLQGMYFFEDHFSLEDIKRNFEFYEPMTVHESSLSPCIHAVLACRIGDFEKAYEMYVRTARLDLDDYNNDTEDGLHITSMAGTWLAIVKGFGGMQMTDDGLKIAPTLPKKWDSLSFRIVYQDAVLKIETTKEGTSVLNTSDSNCEIFLHDKKHVLTGKAIAFYENKS